MPQAEVATKWGVPVYMSAGRNVCAIAGFKEHVALNFFVPPAALPDPKKRLEGAKKTTTLRLRKASEVDEPAIVRWVKAAVKALAWSRACGGVPRRRTSSRGARWRTLGACGSACSPAEVTFPA